MIPILRFPKNFHIISLLFCLTSLFLKGQSRIYSLNELLDSSQVHYPAILEKQALYQSAIKRVQDTRHEFLPKSTIGDEITLGTNNSIPGSYISYGAIPSSSSGVRSYNTFGSATGNIGFLYNEYELVNFGLRKTSVHYAQSSVNLSKSDLEREIYQLKWNIGQLYFQVLKSKSQLGIDLENIKRYTTVFKVIQALAKAGIKPGADTSLALAELSKTKIIYNQTLGQVNKLLVQLGYLSGIPYDQIRFDSTKVNDLISRLDFQKFKEPFISSSPLVDYYSNESILAAENERLIRKSYLPKILLTGIFWARGSSLDFNNNFGSLPTGLTFQRYNYLGAITFSYNLFNLIHTKDKASIAHFDYLASEYRLKQEQLNMKNLENLSQVGISTADKNLREIPIQIKAAEDAFRQKTAQYKAGIINLVDLTNASYVLYRAQSDFVQVKSDWLLAHLDQAAAIGNLYQFIQYIQ